MSFLQKIKQVFKKKQKPKKSNKPTYLKEPIQTYNRKEHRWTKSFYIDYSQNDVSPNQSQTLHTQSSLHKKESRKGLHVDGQKSKD